MSVPVGQSLAQPLQDRQRSRASWTSGARNPPVTRRPSIISCSTRARPRVESFSSRVAWKDGHMTPLDPALSAMHLPTPVHRWTALPKSPSSCSSRSPSRPSSRSRDDSGPRRSASSGLGRTRTPGLSRSSGSNTPLTWANRSMASAEYISGSSSDRARPSPCSPENDPPCEATSVAASNMNDRNSSLPPAASSGKSMRTWMQPSPKCPYGTPSSPFSRSSASNSRR